MSVERKSTMDAKGLRRRIFGYVEYICFDLKRKLKDNRRLKVEHQCTKWAELKKRVPEKYRNIRILNECLTKEFKYEPRILGG